MAPENVKGKKRKGATDASPKPKKQKKSDETTAKPVEAPAKTKIPRKKSEDMWDEDMAVAEETPKKTSTKSQKEKSKEEPAHAQKGDVSAAAETKKSKKSKKTEALPKEPSPVAQSEDEDSESGGEEEDDQTAALLAGFESDRDESDAERQDDAFDHDDVQAKVPKGLMKKLKSVPEKTETPGVVFVGRIPHGFYEKQMKSYFSQFGKVTRLRVSRNKKTGAPKHYAFVEFESAYVADIVAKTMDKYLMFGHILQCSVIPPEQVHPNLFVGANQRFKTIPRNKIAGNEMARGVERKVWEKRIENETKRRAKKNKALKEKLGYEFAAPALKTVEDVPKSSAVLGDADSVKAIEAPAAKSDEVAATEAPKAKKTKKTRKSDVAASAETGEATENVESPAKSKTEPAVQTSKEKKRKVPAVDAGSAKAKKTKKSKA